MSVVRADRQTTGETENGRTIFRRPEDAEYYSIQHTITKEEMAAARADGWLVMVNYRKKITTFCRPINGRELVDAMSDRDGGKNG